MKIVQYILGCNSRHQLWTGWQGCCLPDRLCFTCKQKHAPMGFDNTVSEASFGHIFIAHAQKQLFRNFRTKIWPCHSLWRPRFPI